MPKSKKTKIADSCYGLMNRSNSASPRPFYKTNPNPPLPIIEDAPKQELPNINVTLVEFNPSENISSGICFAHTVSGSSVALWKHPNDYRSVMFPTPVQDFSKYTHIEFMIYSDFASNATFTFELRGLWENCAPEPPHFRYVIRQNWYGWKSFSVDLATLDARYNGTLEDIRFVGFHATGWENDLYGIPGAHLYFSNIYLTRHESDYQPRMEDVTPPVLENLKERWTNLLVGSPKMQEQYSLVDEHVKTYKGHGGKFFASMHKEENTTYLWEDCANLRRGEEVQINAERLFYMARAWSAYNTETYHNKEYLSAILFGLEWLWKNAYGKECLKKYGTGGNWWQWTIGIPWALVKCLLLIRNEVSLDFISRILDFADERDYYPFMTNANRTWISYVCILSSLLQNDVSRLIECIRRMQTVFGYVECSDGFYRDGSFIMHANKAYIGGYGSNYLFQLSDFFYILAGSPLAIPDKYTRMTMNQFFASYVPFIYHGVMAKSVNGRGVLGDGLAVGLSTSALKLVSIATKEEKQKLYQFIRFCIDTNPRYATVLRNQLEHVTVEYYEELMSAPAQEAPNFARVFNGMDRAISQTATYSASLSYNTCRTCRYESINKQNERGWYQHEGSLCISTTNPFAYDGDFYLESNPYRFPGTTVPDVDRVDGCVVFLPCGTYEYGGGVDDGSFAMVGLHQGYKAFNFPWPYDFQSDLDLKKGWFFYDGGVLCLVSALNSSDNNKIYTTIDNRRISNDTIVFVDGTPMNLLSKEQKITATKIECKDFGTYLFPEPTELLIKKTKGTKYNYLELVMPHGKNPKDLSFSYLMLPNVLGEEATKIQNLPPVEILSNTKDVMAVKHSPSTKAYAFYNENVSFDGIETSGLCTLMTQSSGNTLRCIINDPTHMQKELTLTFDEEYSVVDSNEEITSQIKDHKTIVTINTNGSLGVKKSFTLVK